MSEFYYRVPTETARAELVITKSRFIATAGFAPTADAAKATLDNIRTEMPDASHHVHAFRAGYGNSVVEGMSDDGEPSGTAGPPILSILRGTDIGDVIVVVTRYFGGTKLGTGGLVRAYGDAARAVLDDLPTAEKIPKRQLMFAAPYSFYKQIKRLMAAHEGVVDSEAFAADVTIVLTLPHANSAAFERELIDLTAGVVTPLLLHDDTL